VLREIYKRLYGHVAHGVLERANMADLAEKRFFMDVECGGRTYKISAQIDTLSITGGTLSDFKFTTSWGFRSDKAPKAEWIAQLNIQLELLRRNGLDAKQLRIVGLLRDWQYREAKYDPSYPQAPVATVDIPMWSSAQTIAFIKMRIATHLDAASTLPECSDEERYTAEPQFAVIKPGAKKALKCEVTEAAARAWLAKHADKKAKGAEIVFRQGERRRCEFYCPVADYCTQWKREKNNKTEENESESA
jgi:hypothetical protein